MDVFGVAARTGARPSGVPRGFVSGRCPGTRPSGPEGVRRWLVARWPGNPSAGVPRWVASGWWPRGQETRRSGITRACKWPVAYGTGNPPVETSTGGLAVVARGGVEPPTFRFSVGRSYQLSYLAVREARPERYPSPAAYPKVPVTPFPPEVPNVHFAPQMFGCEVPLSRRKSHEHLPLRATPPHVAALDPRREHGNSHRRR